MAPNELQLQSFSFNYNPNINLGDNMMSMMQSQMGNFSLGNGINLSNILAGIDNIEQLNSDNGQQQANAVQGLMNNLMGILSKLGNQEAAAAGSEVNKNQQNANQTVSYTEEEKAKINEKLTENKNQIDEENGKIKLANENAEELQKQLEEEQKKIQETLAKINGLQQQLGGETEPAEQEKLLNAITSELTAMNDSFALIATIKENLAANCSTVEEAGKKLETLATDSTKTVENGANRLESLAAEAQQDIQSNSQTQTKAPVNTATAAELTAAGNAANIFSAAAARKFYTAAADQSSAASIRETGTAAVWTKISQSIGNISNSANLLSTFNTAIGSAFQSTEGLIGSWSTTLSPMITSIGSVESFQAQADEFGLIVEEDKNTVNASTKPKNYVEAPAEANPADKARPQSNKFLRASMMQQDWTQAQDYKNELQTPRVQMKFGI